MLHFVIFLQKKKKGKKKRAKKKRALFWFFITANNGVAASCKIFTKKQKRVNKKAMKGLTGYDDEKMNFADFLLKKRQGSDLLNQDF